MKLAEILRPINENNLRQLSDAKYAEIIWKMDKWLPNEPEIQDEYYDIPDGDIEAMKDFLEANADEYVLRRYGFNGDWTLLAKAALRKR